MIGRGSSGESKYKAVQQLRTTYIQWQRTSGEGGVEDAKFRRMGLITRTGFAQKVEEVRFPP